MLINLKELEYTGTGCSSLKKEIFSSICTESVIIDGGCKQGWWMQAMNRYIPGTIRPTLTKIGIDPISYEDTQKNGQYTQYIQAAIGLEDEESVDFYIIGSEPGCNSLLKPSQELQSTTYNGVNREVSEIKKVKKVRLDTVLDGLSNLSKVYYVKFDLQGADLDGVKSLGKYLDIVEYIELELSLDSEKPFYEDSPDLEEILSTLESFDFEVIEFSSFPESPLPEGELLFRRKEC